MKDISAIHYDHEMEQVAKSSYKKLLDCDHVNSKQRIAACLLSAATFVLGASPDLLASCSCCWEDVVEFKCPYTCKDVSPFVIPPSFLKVVNVTMKHKLQIHTRLRFGDKWALLGENGATFLFFQQKNIFHEFLLIRRVGFR